MVLPTQKLSGKKMKENPVFNPTEIARFIDHTLLKPDATSAAIREICSEALEYQFATVCINPVHVKLVKSLLSGSPVNTCSVVGFPLGAHLPETKAGEALHAIEEGAVEIDMVMNIGSLKGGEKSLTFQDMQRVIEVCHRNGALCKVIIETALLTDPEKVAACELAVKAGADFVKTSTGFASGGATAADVRLLKQTVEKSGVLVKASGGIRSYADALKMIEAGASRIGTSSGVKIMEEARNLIV